MSKHVFFFDKKQHTLHQDFADQKPNQLHLCFHLFLKPYSKFLRRRLIYINLYPHRDPTKDLVPQHKLHLSFSDQLQFLQCVPNFLIPYFSSFFRRLRIYKFHRRNQRCADCYFLQFQPKLHGDYWGQELHIQ